LCTGQLGTLSGQAAQQPVTSRNHRGHECDGAHTDDKLERCVNHHRALDKRQESLHQPCPQTQTGHVGGEDERDGDFGRAEHERKLARPGDLVDDARESTQRKAHRQHEHG
jgi:hypothetical protein